MTVNTHYSKDIGPLLSVVFTVAYSASLFLVFVSSVGFDPLFLITLLASIIVSSFICLVFGSIIKEMPLFVSTIVCGIIANAAFYLLPTEFLRHLIFFIFSGIVIGTLFPVNTKLLCSFWRVDIRGKFALCLLLGIALVLPFFLLAQEQMAQWSQLFLCGSLIVLFSERDVIGRIENRTKEDNAFAIKVSWRARGASALMSMAAMFVGVYLLMTNDLRSTTMALIACITAAGVTLLDGHFKTGFAEETRLRKLIVPLMSSLLFFNFANDLGRAFFCFIVLLCFSTHLILGFASLLIRVGKSQMSYVWTTESGSLTGGLGALVGAALALFSFQKLDSGDLSFMVASSALIFIFIWFFTLFAQNEYPEGGEDPETGETQAYIARPFISGCNQLSEKYNLSERKKDILFQLAKGRGSKHIAEELCISQTTVKTHIYQIYRTVGVSSREELIDLIEAEAETVRL